MKSRRRVNSDVRRNGFLVIKMGFGIVILLSDKKLPTERYVSFVNACTSIFGDWDIDELAPLNLNADETVHDFVLVHANKPLPR
jgi:hypothetical protein